MTTVISVEYLSKAYQLGQIGTGTLTNDLKVWWARKRGSPNPMLRVGEDDHGNWDSETLWALKDVSFRVEHGEVLGIIGRNGAGKSTLLKVLSRITAPTAGRVKVKGRVASLLEVGTGFHPELTGRENIYLNGAILGMRTREIDRKFDEIVDFAEIEKFIDTPVKRYSSGMYVRLAFAVAAHLEPEILLVDEVLAVGDAEFQKKCLGKMGDIAHKGRTVLFVSHNMPAVANLCERCLLIQAGALSIDGMSRGVIDRYLGRDDSRANHGIATLSGNEERSGIGGGEIEKLELENSSGYPTFRFGIGEPISVKMYIRLRSIYSSIVSGVEIRSMEGMQLLNLRSDSQGISFGPYRNGEEVILTIKIPGLPLYPGTYFLEPWIAEHKGKRIDHIHNAAKLTLEPKGQFRSEMLIQKGRGVVIMDCAWTTEVNSIHGSQ